MSGVKHRSETSRLQVEETEIGKVLTRTSGYLTDVTSHSLQPYKGCTLGNSLCGVSCYVQHSRHITLGRPWGSFLEVRRNSAESYLRHVAAERRWARKHRGDFSVFLSSATEPFPPQESRFLASHSVLEAMCQEPPDVLVVQTHSHRVMNALEVLERVNERCQLRCHISIEGDRDRLPGLPAPGSTVDSRFAAASALKQAGIRVVITVSPLLPMRDPDVFFDRVAATADAVVLDHFIGGDGSRQGQRTRRTALPSVMEAVLPGSSSLDYRDKMAQVAQRHLPGRVGISVDGFAGRF